MSFEQHVTSVVDEASVGIPLSPSSSAHHQYGRSNCPDNESDYGLPLSTDDHVGLRDVQNRRPAS